MMCCLNEDMKMKWSSPKEELDGKAEVIVKEFRKRKQIVLFGAGKIGEEIRGKLDYYGIFGGFIDNDRQKQSNGKDGMDVYSLEHYLQTQENKWIVISTGEEKYDDICRQLKESGLKEKIDFWKARDFVEEILPIISFYHFNKLYVDLAQISVTERCTLHCQKCAHACQNVDCSKEDMSLEKVKESADYFFKYVDIVSEFVLIGGEPLLYKELSEAIKYIGEYYRNKIMIFSITTNGTIIPDDKFVEVCKKYDVTIRIFDYSNTLPRLSRRYQHLYEKLNGLSVIIWKTDKENSWFDYGFDTIDRGEDTQVLLAAFDGCKTNCREIRGSRYYYCVMARSVPENLGWNIGEKDFLELEGLEDKKLFFEFQQGFSKKGYLDMCRYCRGADAKNYLVPAAEQGEQA